MLNTEAFTVSEKFAGATYANSTALEEDLETEAEDFARAVAEDSAETVAEEETAAGEDTTEEATEVAAEVAAEDLFEDEEMSLSLFDEPASNCSLEDMLTICESLDAGNSEATAVEESPEQLQTIPAVKTVAAKTPEESLYIGTFIEQKT